MPLQDSPSTAPSVMGEQYYPPRIETVPTSVRVNRATPRGPAAAKGALPKPQAGGRSPVPPAVVQRDKPSRAPQKRKAPPRAPGAARNGTAVQQVRRLHRKDDASLITALGFQREVRAIMNQLPQNRGQTATDRTGLLESKATGHAFRFSRTGLCMLQEAAEDFLLSHFQRSALIAAHVGRKTIGAKDLRLSKKLVGSTV